jgi:FixJ family two-component response regulator
VFGRKKMDYRLALITQDPKLEKLVRRSSDHFGYELGLYESCTAFAEDSRDNELGVVVLDASVCSQPSLMDLQMVLNGAPAWRVIYLPSTNKKNEIKEAMDLGAFGCLHRPVNEQEIRQMVQSAMGI